MPTTLAQKLQIKSDKLIVLNTPRDYAELLKGSAKMTSDVNRDKLWAAVQPLGWRPVRQITPNEAWSATCFKPGM